VLAVGKQQHNMPVPLRRFWNFSSWFSIGRGDVSMIDEPVLR
jgi:hypothetical protein